MSSNLVFDLPSNVDETRLHEIIESVRSKAPTSLLFDWTECSEIDKVSLCLLLNLTFECEQNNIRVRHTSHEKNPFFKSSILPFVSFPFKSIEIQESDVGVFLTGVDKDEEILSRVTAMIKYLRSLPQLDTFNINPLEIIVSELYMNICQHSWKKNGVLFVHVEPENHIIELIISDIGVGIPANIKEAFHEFESKSDAEAILHATEDFITTRSIEQNYGRGLSTLKTSVISLNGNARISSGYGEVEIQPDGLLLGMYDIYHNGTQIHIRIDFRNFDTRVDSEFTEDISF